MRFIPTKNSVMDSYSGSNYNISKNKIVEVGYNVVGKILSFKHIVMVFNLSKKDPTTRHALKTKLSFKSFGKYLRKMVCVGISLL